MYQNLKIISSSIPSDLPSLESVPPQKKFGGWIDGLVNLHAVTHTFSNDKFKSVELMTIMLRLGIQYKLLDAQRFVNQRYFHLRERVMSSILGRGGGCSRKRRHPFFARTVAQFDVNSFENWNPHWRGGRYSVEVIPWKCYLSVNYYCSKLT